MCECGRSNVSMCQTFKYVHKAVLQKCTNEATNVNFQFALVDQHFSHLKALIGHNSKMKLWDQKELQCLDLFSKTKTENLQTAQRIACLKTWFGFKSMHQSSHFKMSIEFMDHVCAQSLIHPMSLAFGCQKQSTPDQNAIFPHLLQVTNV